ncbi:MAG: peptidoglycan-binding protein [Calothrix sp. C42_A2020_038]|nr:peptidoglycan-binding protein [Calothrix sp. C42_A2020_038]
MKPIADSCVALTSDVIVALKIWKKLSSIAAVGLFSLGASLTMTLKTATAEINITQQYTATKQHRSDRRYPTLRRNNQGQEVEYLQYRLWEWGYFKQKVTGFFGHHTENAVKRFQHDKDIFPTGIVDAQTWDAIEKPSTTPKLCNRPTLQPGSDGKDVLDLQQRLYDLGYLKVRPSGYFGEASKLAVIRFQKQQDLPANGIVNAQTWEALKLSCKPEVLYFL